MKDEPTAKGENRSLDERFASRPHVYARLQSIADLMDKAMAEGHTADEAEAMAVEQIQRLGQELLTDWAQEKQNQSVRRAQAEHPQASQHIKKKVSWFTTFGAVEVWEQVLRLSRRGKQLRPFYREAAVQHRGYSRRLQRVLVDFGAEDSFEAAARRVEEHYGINVASTAVRRQTLKHGRAMNSLPASQRTAPGLVTQMDGSMIPVIEPGQKADRRTGKKLFWREVRLCSVRVEGQVQPIYGATLGSAQTASWLWQQTAQAGGCGPKTSVHGVGDGPRWIVDKFEENFGAQGSYLIDFYHVSQYLAAAAASICPPGREKQWLRRQQGRLLGNQVAKVLRALYPHQEAAGVEEAPVRVAYGYLRERRHHLDYAGAQRRGLPIGSGEIESAHRHVVQQRLKLSGCWWKEANAHSMLNLRVARANQLWTSYWSSTLN